MIPQISKNNSTDIPVLSCAEIKELDRRATEEFGISVETLMENAGRAVADETVKFLEEREVPKPWKIAIFCGGGNNGGDGLVTARLLHQKKISVSVLLFKKSDQLKGSTQTNFLKIKNLGISFRETPDLKEIKREISKSDLLIDAIFGIGLKDEIKEPLLQIIEEMNQSKKPILAIDIPSGLNADSGIPQGNCIKATITVTMGAMKKGFLKEEAKKQTGKIVVAEIGYPKELLKELSKSDS